MHVLKRRNRLKSFLASKAVSAKRPLGSLNIIFCSDEHLLGINRDYLQHDYYTDIITFDLSENKMVTADIYISVDRVRDNAKTLGLSFKSEIHRVIFHGALHLCGYRDKNTMEIKKMRGKEDLYLKKYGVSPI